MARVLRLAITLGVLAYFVRRLDLSATLTAVSALSLGTLTAMAGLTAIDRGLMAWRWILLVRATGIGLSAKSGLWIFLVSSFLGTVAPAGIGGDVARAWELRQRTARGTDAIAAGAVDRWLGLTSVALLGAYGLARLTWAIDSRIAIAMVTLVAVTLTGAVVGLWADLALSTLLPGPWLTRTPWRQLHTLASALGAFRHQWRAVLWVGVLSLAVQVLRVVLAWVIGRGLGITVGLDYYLVIMPVAIVLILLPISVGGLGPAQAAIVWMMQPLGVDPGLAFAMGTLFVLLGLVGNLPGALLWLRQT